MTSSLRRNILATIAVVALCAPTMAFAQNNPPAQGGGQAGSVSGLLGAGLSAAAPKELQQGASTNLPALAGNIIRQLLSLTGVVLFGYLLYGGFKYMTSGGDSKGADAGMQIIRHAVIGLIIIAASYAIANYVINNIIGGALNPGGPQG